MDVRPYAAADREPCLELFDSNTPASFTAAERPDYAAFLDAMPCPYFVLEHDGRIVGAGGYAIQGAEGRLVWGMIGKPWQRQGLGRFLVMYRLREIGKAGDTATVGIDTSQHTAPFFAKLGFKTLRVDPDFYAPGLDRVAMVKKMTVCP